MLLARTAIDLIIDNIPNFYFRWYCVVTSATLQPLQYQLVEAVLEDVLKKVVIGRQVVTVTTNAQDLTIAV